MQSALENRVWLTWLVKVRILILTVLLGIELVIAQFQRMARRCRSEQDESHQSGCPAPPKCGRSGLKHLTPSAGVMVFNPM